MRKHGLKQADSVETRFEGIILLYEADGYVLLCFNGVRNSHILPLEQASLNGSILKSAPFSVVEGATGVCEGGQG